MTLFTHLIERVGLTTVLISKGCDMKIMPLSKIVQDTAPNTSQNSVIYQQLNPTFMCL